MSKDMELTDTTQTAGGALADAASSDRPPGAGTAAPATTGRQPAKLRRRDLFRLAGKLATAAPPAFVAARAGAQTSYAKSRDRTSEINYMSATRLAELIRAREISAVEAVDAYIARQIEVNDRLNAVVMNSYGRAREEARALDRRLARGEIAGALHGVPMTIKDSIDTAGVITTGATYGRQQYVPEKDATVVARLRAAGAILLGKTNTPEFTLGGLSGINTSSNLLYGSSHNPYDLTRSTAGSSGGAGASVAAGLSAFDVGSDWGGSIRGPAHNNGIVGIKPTSVRVPRTGHIVDYGGIFDLWQQLGPMCRKVEDIATITPIISGPDFRDAACAPAPWLDPAAVDLAALRVAFVDDNGSTGPEATDADTKATVRNAAGWLEDAVASIVEDAPADLLLALTDARRRLTNGDGWAFYQRLVDKWGTNNFSPRRVAAMAEAEPSSSAEMVVAWEDQDACKSKLLNWFQDYDVLICPVDEQPAQPIDQVGGRGGNAGGWTYRGVFNCTGWPVVVVRCGSSSDGALPIGLQVVAQPWREDVAIAVAAYLESRSGGWKAPPI